MAFRALGFTTSTHSAVAAAADRAELSSAVGAWPTTDLSLLATAIELTDRAPIPFAGVKRGKRFDSPEIGCGQDGDDPIADSNRVDVEVLAFAPARSPERFPGHSAAIGKFQKRVVVGYHVASPWVDGRPTHFGIWVNCRARNRSGITIDDDNRSHVWEPGRDRDCTRRHARNRLLRKLEDVLGPNRRLDDTVDEVVRQQETLGDCIT